ncbi:MAG TPA: hypothetical protein VGL56_02265 [Fimbriimonadaceae bacterium]|jgi:flagellar assembly factor FliW
MKKIEYDDGRIKLPPEMEAAIREGLKGFENLEGMSLEQAHELARMRTKAWMQVKPQDKSA